MEREGESQRGTAREKDGDRPRRRNVELHIPLFLSRLPPALLACPTPARAPPSSGPARTLPSRQTLPSPVETEQKDQLTYRHLHAQPLHARCQSLYGRLELRVHHQLGHLHRRRLLSIGADPFDPQSTTTRSASFDLAVSPPSLPFDSPLLNIASPIAFKFRLAISSPMSFFRTGLVLKASRTEGGREEVSELDEGVELEGLGGGVEGGAAVARERRAARGAVVRRERRARRSGEGERCMASIKVVG